MRCHNLFSKPKMFYKQIYIHFYKDIYLYRQYFLTNVASFSKKIKKNRKLLKNSRNQVYSLFFTKNEQSISCLFVMSCKLQPFFHKISSLFVIKLTNFNKKLINSVQQFNLKTKKFNFPPILFLNYFYLIVPTRITNYLCYIILIKTKMFSFLLKKLIFF